MNLFMTHHAPVGAWASMTFGAYGCGVSFDIQEPLVKKSANLLIGTAEGRKMTSLPFCWDIKEEKEKETELDVHAEGSKEEADASKIACSSGNAKDAGAAAQNGSEQKKQAIEKRYFAAADITRTLTPGIDRYEAGKLSFTVYTPHDALPDPEGREKAAIPKEFCVPAIYMELGVDNTSGGNPVTAYIGLDWLLPGRLHYFERDGLCGYQFRDEWCLAARKDEAGLICGCGAAEALCSGTQFVHCKGDCYLAVTAAPGEKKILPVVWAFHQTRGSYGIDTEYYYTTYFSDMFEAAGCALADGEDRKNRCRALDQSLQFETEQKREIFSQALRGYYASTQLLTGKDGRVYYNVSEGAYLWRNTLDLAADHLAWELRHNPWVVRCIMDQYLERYSYVDTVRFAGIDGEYPGGISFTHDMGNYFTYTEPGHSDYEHADMEAHGCYFYMTTEELLNGIYCIAGYALTTKDRDWLAAKESALEALLLSLENREGFCEDMRDGILKAESTRCGAQAGESTTYDAIDHSLKDSAGNNYIAVKTLCALEMLKACFDMLGRKGLWARAGAMQERGERTLVQFWDSKNAYLRANLYHESESYVAAAAEPLVILAQLGLSLSAFCTGVLKAHMKTCLCSGKCIDAQSGGLRISSRSRNTWVSKVILSLYAAKELLSAISEEEEARCCERVRDWCQKTAAEATISDQIFCDTGELVGGLYYPRIVTAAVWAHEA
ncbi:MAG: hypothetical protein J6B85_09050 [Lachnospiraceae bacterium]|nr:hypothetical protein [Lachnospiraceae bacterium]